MKTRALGAVSVLALSAGAAHAGDPAMWDGPYLGGNFGIGILDGTLTITDLFFAGSNKSDLSDTGVTFGGQAGWNFLVDQFLLGIEGDFNFIDLDDRASFFGGKRTISARVDYDWFATLRARAGMPMDNLLFYVTGGVAFMGGDIKLTDSFIGPGGASDSDTLVGWTIGGGVEWAFDEKWSAKAEYLYADFESHSVSVPFVSSARANPNVHILRVGLNYHFCTGGPC